MNSPVKFGPIRAQKLDVERDQRVTMVRSKATSLSVKAGLFLASEVSLKLKVRLINTTFYFPCIKKLNLSLQSFEK